MASFPTTEWTLVGLAAGRSSSECGEALASMFRRYWSPMCVFVRSSFRLSLDEAEECVQGFVTEVLIDGSLLVSADPAKGRFRAVLCRSLKNYVVQRFRRESTQKRYVRELGERMAREADSEGDGPLLSFEIAWAIEVFAEILARMRCECDAKGRSDAWKVFQWRILEPLFSGTETPDYDKIAKRQPGKSQTQLMNLLVTARRQFARHQEEVLREYSAAGVDADAICGFVAARLKSGKEPTEGETQTQSVADVVRNVERVVASRLGVDGRETSVRKLLNDDLAEWLADDRRTLMDILRRLFVGCADEFGMALGLLEQLEEHARRKEHASQETSAGGKQSKPVGELNRQRTATLGLMRELASVRLAQDSRLPCVSEVGDPGPSGGDVSAQVESRTQLLEELVGENQSQMRHLSPEEMTAILQHELDSPVEFSLSGLGSKEAARLTRLASGQGLLLKSLRELFEHSHPPIELLEMTKDFAKAHSHQSGGEIPVEVASVIYFGAIAAAWVRHQKSITNLQTKERRRGFQWALGQTWVDGQLKRLFEDALRQLEN